MAKTSMTARWKALAAEYGRLAIVIYLVIFALVFTGSVATIHFGVRVDSTAGAAGTLGAAWLATKLTQPLRIGATLVLTPIVAAILARLRRRPKSADAE